MESCSKLISSYDSNEGLRCPEKEILAEGSDGEEEAESAESQQRERSKDIDGGTAWLCVLGAFIMTTLMGGVEKSFGVLLISIQAEFNCTTERASWIGSLMTTLRHLMCVFSGMLAQRFGARRIAFLGALLMFASMCASSFVKTLPLLYLTYGILPGIGASLMYISMTIIINERFVKRIGKANGVSLAGSGLGSFGGPVVIQVLLDTYGLSGAIFIVGALTANYFLCTALFIPAIQVKSKNGDCNITEGSLEGDISSPVILKLNKEKHQSRRCPDLALRRPPVGFILLCFSLGLLSAGYIASVYLLPSLAQLNKGITPLMADLLISIIGISDIVGILTGGVVFDLKKVKKWRRHIYCSIFLIMSLVNLALPFCTQYYQLCLCSTLTGYFVGFLIGQRAVMCLDIVGSELLNKYLGLLVSSQGVGFLIGPATAGALKDYFVADGFVAAYYFCSAAQLLAAMLFSVNIMATSCLTARDAKQARLLESNQPL